MDMTNNWDLNQKFWSLTRGQVTDFLIDSLGYSFSELEELSDDEIMNLVPTTYYQECYDFNKGLL